MNCEVTQLSIQWSISIQYKFKSRNSDIEFFIEINDKTTKKIMRTWRNGVCFRDVERKEKKIAMQVLMLSQEIW